MRSDIQASEKPTCCDRRLMLGGVLAGSVCAGLWAGDATAGGGDDIVQPEVLDDATFIARAFKMRDLATALGDQAYGAVVVRGTKIIGQSHSRVISENDPTGHAELAAIRDAARRIGDRDLGGSILYSSSRPCPMCEAAAYWANIAEMRYGRGATNAGSPKLCG